MTISTVFLLTAAFFATLVFTRVSISMAHRLKMVDVPEARKIHAVIIPRGVGLGFSAVWMVLTAGLLFFGGLDEAGFTATAGLLAGASIVVLLGFVDDLLDISSGIKLVAQFGAAIVFLVVAQTFFMNNLVLAALAVFWIIGVTNSFNLIDGLDGLAAGLGIISGISFAILGFALGQPTLLTLSLLLVVVCLGFISYNWHPAKAFMGDVGSLFLGFVLATLGLMSFDKTIAPAALVPLFFIAVPLFDTVLSIARRVLHRKPLFEPDRFHFYNLLMDRGFTHTGSVFFCYALAALFSILGFCFLFAQAQTVRYMVSGAGLAVLAVITAKYRFLAMD